MKPKIIVFLTIILLLLSLFAGCLDEDTEKNHPPEVSFLYPENDQIVSDIVKITGRASDVDGEGHVQKVEVKINGSDWVEAEGTDTWSYDWVTYKSREGNVPIYARSWDGAVYSDIAERSVIVDNAIATDSNEHRWAVFVISANFADKNETKLGNGGLLLAEEMAEYYIETLNYPTDNVYILFDDGWIRDDNGYGNRIETLEQRPHTYDITYGGATEQNVKSILYHVVEEANQFSDSEVFLWFAGHGWGDENNQITGGKILERSAIFLWDDVFTDRELGDILYSLRSDETCIIVDACFSGGFADKTILNFPTLFLLNSGIPGSGRVVITGASKFRPGYASTTRGPLFTLLWFEGLLSGEADGFRPGLLSTGKPPRFGMSKDGDVSVEEAFYYARYVLKNDENLDDYDGMEPQINDQYPHRGNLRSKAELVLGE
ncbi:MAG: caspase family protein [Candidatus Thermoplasmatota archaeon]|nr:caspase family protein [Candidatus Thermoplasmatota archaeon]MBS3801632.1 caspase family protein [Candidatus Thermoplasmatota archaeon]